MADEWRSWVKTIPEDLARYVNPVAAEKALPAGFLRSVSDLVVGGDRRGALEFLYVALAREEIAYTWEDINLSDQLKETQVIRPPADIVDSAVQNRATCLDLCLFLASLCVSVRLLPFLVLVKTPDRSHALVMVDAETDVEEWTPDRVGWPAEAGEKNFLERETAAGFLAWGLAPPGRLVPVETTGFAHTFLDNREERAVLRFEEAAQSARQTVEDARNGVVVVDVVKLSALRAPYIPPPSRRARLGDLVWEPHRISEINPYRPPVSLRRPEVEESKFDFETTFPPYIPRRRLDHRLDTALAGERRFVLLVGKPQTGKTRAGFEAVSRCCGEKSLLIPDIRQLGALIAEFHDLGLDPEDHVLWLDNLHGYLDTSDTLSPHQLDQLVSEGLTVVATIWTEKHRWLRGAASPTRTGMRAGGIQAVARQTFALVSATINVPGEADLQELEAAEIVDAYNHLEFSEAVGIAETLTAVPTVREHYQALDDYPTKAVVDAAIALTRAGAGPEVPIGAVRVVYADRLQKLAPGIGETETGTAFQPALTRATAPIGDTHQRLLTRPNGTVQPFPRLVHEATQQSDPIPDTAWTTAIRTADSWTVAVHAYQEQRLDIAEQLFTKLAQSDDPDLASAAAFNLGWLLEGAGRVDEAEAAYRKASESDATEAAPMASFRLGLLFAGAGRVEEAEAAYRKAIESGDPDEAGKAEFNLGLLFAGAGRVDEAEAAYRKAIESGDPEVAPMAALNLGLFLAEEGRVEEAEAEYRKAIESGDPEVAPMASFNLGDLLGKAGRVEQAEAAFREAVASGPADWAPKAALNLGLFLAKEGRVEEAEAEYRKAIESGHPEVAPMASFNLGNLLRKAGRVKEAEAAFREAVARGPADWAQKAALNLGLFLAEEGRVEEAEAAFWEAIESGHPEAAPIASFNLGHLLAEADRVEEAEAVFRGAMESGDPDEAGKAAFNLGLMFAGAGRVEEAVTLGNRLANAGRVDEAEAVYREAMASGDPDAAPAAAFNLGLLFVEAGQVEEAEAAFREALESGHPDAAPKAAGMLQLKEAWRGTWRRVEDAEAAGQRPARFWHRWRR